MADEQGIMSKPAGWVAGTKNYIEELQHEMKLVTWPSWKQVRATTGVVIFLFFMLV